MSARDVVPTGILEVYYHYLQKKSIIDRVFAAFVFEARRADGNFYPGATIRNIHVYMYHVLAALLCVMEHNQGASNVISFVHKVRCGV